MRPSPDIAARSSVAVAVTRLAGGVAARGRTGGVTAAASWAIPAAGDEGVTEVATGLSR